MTAPITAPMTTIGCRRINRRVVGVTDDETRKYEEKIDGQIAVVDPLVEMAGRIGFEQMEPDDHDRRYAAQSVEYVVVRFGVCKCS